MAVTGTAITNATPAVVTSVGHGYPNGTRIILEGTTGMFQISTMEFTVSNVSADNYDLAGLPAAGFAAPATALTSIRMASTTPVVPQRYFITAISIEKQAVITVSMIHGYVADQLVYMRIPRNFGMQQMNGVTGKVLSVTDYTITTDIDSQGFDSFSFPISPTLNGTSLVGQISFPKISPAGQRNGFNVTNIPFR